MAIAGPVMTGTPFGNSVQISWFAVVVIKCQRGISLQGLDRGRRWFHTSSGIPPVTVQLSTNLDTPSGNYCRPQSLRGGRLRGWGRSSTASIRTPKGRDADTEAESAARREPDPRRCTGRIWEPNNRGLDHFVFCYALSHRFTGRLAGRQECSVGR